MKPNKKVYRVQIGLIESGMDHPNHDSRTVLAEDTITAMKKVRLRKDCYISQVEIIVASLDKL